MGFVVGLLYVFFYGVCALFVIGLICVFFEGESVFDKYLKSLSPEERQARGYNWSREPVRRGDQDDIG